MGWLKRKDKNDIEKWRRKIDKIDVKIVKLLNRRARYANEIGKIKEELNGMNSFFFWFKTFSILFISTQF